jgi:hypothetical protein
MNHQSNNPVRQHIEQTVLNQISTVVQQYLLKNPEATPEAVALFETTVSEKILASAKKQKFLNSKVIRKLRKDYTNQTAAGLGLSFYHLDAARGNTSIPKEIQEIVSKLEEISGKDFGIAEMVKVTVAARFAAQEDGKFAIEMSFAVKNPNDEDEYDELIGKEYALEYFLAGKIKIHELKLGRFMESLPTKKLGEFLDQYLELNK